MSKALKLDVYYPYCPGCDETLDAALKALDGQQVAPKEGDLTICVYCHAQLIFKGEGKNMHLEFITDEDISVMTENDPGLWERYQEIYPKVIEHLNTINLSKNTK